MLQFNNKILSVNNKWLNKPLPPLRDYSVRLLFRLGVTPTFSKGTGTQISVNPNIWDLRYNNTSWYQVLASQPDLLEIIDSTTSHVTNFSDLCMNSNSLRRVHKIDTSSATSTYAMFYQCTDLLYVPVFDTSKSRQMQTMFTYCTKLRNIPLLDTSSAEYIGFMCYGCTNVRSGALALYQQASIRESEIIYGNCFTNCGINTPTGLAELEQIPTSWGGKLQ